ncbi:MAG: hypothetical protein ABW275_03760, partial [Hansschlegelia sp.]
AEPYNDRSLSSTPHEVVAASVRPAPVIRDRPVAVEERVAVARNRAPEPEPFDIASNGVDQQMPADGPDGIPQYEPLPSAHSQQGSAPSRYERLAQADLPRQAPSRSADVPQYEPAPAPAQPRSAPSRYERLAQADLPRREVRTDVPVYEASAAATRSQPRPAPSRYERLAQAETPRREIQPDVPVYEPEPAPVRPQPRPAPSRYERLAQAELPPTSYEPRRERREEPRAVVSRPLPEPVESRPLPAPVAERAPARVPARDIQDNSDAPRPAAPSRRRETPQELGWNVGAQPTAVDDIPAEYVPSVPARGEAQNYDEPTGATKRRGKDRIVRGY